jgi:hypothetical protein
LFDYPAVNFSHFQIRINLGLYLDEITFPGKEIEE